MSTSTSPLVSRALIRISDQLADVQPGKAAWRGRFRAVVDIGRSQERERERAHAIVQAYTRWRAKALPRAAKLWQDQASFIPQWNLP